MTGDALDHLKSCSLLHVAVVSAGRKEAGRTRIAQAPDLGELVSAASVSRTKCTRPKLSPTIIVRPSEAIAQQPISLSPVKAAISFPLSRSHSRSVRSSEAEAARRPSGVTATARTGPVWPQACAVFGRFQGPIAAAFGPPKPRSHGGRRVSPPRPESNPCGPRACAMFGRSPSPRAAEYRPTKLRRHSSRRVSPLPPGPSPYGL